MESFFSRYKNPLILALLLIAQFILLAVQVRPRLPGAAAADQAGVKVLRRGVTTVVTPPEEAAHASGLGVRGLWSRYIDLVNLKQQNEQLQTENQRLRLEQVAMAEDARQGERLQSLLAFKQHYIEATVPAQIVGTGGSDHGRVVYLDKGSDDGLRPDMPVITPNGIVGRVRDVTASTAQVLEINDPTSAAGVVLEQTRTRGIVRGAEGGQLQIVDMMPDSRVQPGQLVITSGGDQIFPRGLPVGTVVKVQPDEDNPPLVNVILKPAANLGRLEEVLVVTSTSDAPSAAARADLARSQRAARALHAEATAQAASAAEAAAETQSAADVLAARLPSAQGVIDPDAPDAAPGAGPTSASESGPALHPPAALHNDHYTPGDTPSAQELTPGQRAAPYLQGKIPIVKVAPQGQEGALQDRQPGISAAFLAAHQAAVEAGKRSSPAKTTGSAPENTQTHPAGTHEAAPARRSVPVAEPARRSVQSAEPARRALTTADHGTAGPTATHVQSRPAGGTPTPAHAAAAPHARRAPVPMQIITDGPVSGAHRTPSAQQNKPRPSHPRGPVVVPSDGSRPPSSSPQEHR